MDIVANYGGRLIFAAGGVGLALLVLIGVLWLIRNRAPSPFVRGGKNRQPRLQVLDAAAVDARRRLVLVRRDGVEHLIMIGGPTDIVIESGIGDLSKAAAAAQPLPLVQLSTDETPPQPRLDPVREPPRVAARQQEPEKRLPTPPARAAVEPPELPTAERREPVRPAVATAPAPTTPIPAPPMAAPAPIIAAAPIVVTPDRLQPVTVTPASAAPSNVPEPAPAPIIVPERREVSDAVDILEAARQRVLPPTVDQPQKVSDKEPSPVSPPLTPILAQDAYREASFEADVPAEPEKSPVEQPKQLGSDFESILEAEMSNNLSAQRVVAPTTPSPAKPVSNERREPAITGNPRDDAALQAEVARIFGDIDVKPER